MSAVMRVKGWVATTLLASIVGAVVSYATPTMAVFSKLIGMSQEIKQEVHRLSLEVESNVDSRVTYLKLLYWKRNIDRDLAKRIADSITRHAKRTNRDPSLILAIALKESDLNPEAVSSVGAEGLIQVRPHWLKVFGADCDLKDIDCNLRQGLRLLDVYEDLYGSLELALVAYNRGPNPVDWALNKNQNPDNGYAKDVLNLYKQLKEM